MKLLLLYGLFLMPYNFHELRIKPIEANVYVCDSENSVAYHSKKTCGGLNKCTHDRIEVTVAIAKSKYKKRACKLCY